MAATPKTGAGPMSEWMFESPPSQNEVFESTPTSVPKDSESSSTSWKLGGTSPTRQAVSRNPTGSANATAFWADSPTTPAPEHPWEVLGISSDPVRDEILKAFKYLSSRHHPNRPSVNHPRHRAIYIYDALHKAYCWYRNNENGLPVRPGWKQLPADPDERLGSPEAKEFWANTADLPVPRDPYECLGVAPTVDQATIQDRFDTLTRAVKRLSSNTTSRNRLDYIARELGEAYAEIRHSRGLDGSWRYSLEQKESLLNAPPWSRSQTAMGWWYAPESQLIAPEDPYDVLGLDRNVDLAHVHRAANKLLADWDPDHIQDPALWPRSGFVHGKVREAYDFLLMPPDDQEAAISLRKLQEAYPDTFPPSAPMDAAPTIAGPEISQGAGTEPDPVRTMFMHYTISEDRSGDQNSVASARLAALGARSHDTRFSNASLALLGRRSGLG